jgi:pimeloyl-ACP methyl ester carboxylesterase
MARDAVAFIRALGFDEVDLLGFSMGGFVAQVIAEEQPDLIRKVILVGTGPAGGDGIDKVTMLTYLDIARGALTLRDAKYYLFFTETANGRSEARKFLKRLKERTNDRDKSISVSSFRAHLKAIHAWALQEPSDLSRIQQPVFIANGDHDRMVPTQNSADLARRLPNAKLKIYPDAGHGGIFQYHAEFVPEALEFLDA